MICTIDQEKLKSWQLAQVIFSKRQKASQIVINMARTTLS